MTEYQERVERQRLKLEAEEWAKGVASIHAHSCSSMWYDDRPEDTEDGTVMDVQYNNGTIVRTKNDKVIHVFGEELKGDDLIDQYVRTQQNKR